MDVAIVTGASSSLGLAISRRLIDLGFRVYGLGGNFNDISLKNAAFIPMNCNLADAKQVEKGIKQIIEREHAVCLLVNNAKLYPPEDLSESTTEQLERSLAVNLLCPLILVRETLEGLQRLQGQVVNIASATPETGRGGPAGAATAGGLRWMSEQLFQQVRETGVKVTTISPEPNRWRPIDVTPAAGQRPESTIDPEVLAACVADLVSNRSGNVVTEIVLRPQRIVEKPQLPVRELPYPKPQPIPYTVPRAEIEAEELLEDEREIARENRERLAEGGPPEPGTPAARTSEKKRRRRRRSGDRGDRIAEDSGVESGADSSTRKRESHPDQARSDQRPGTDRRPAQDRPERERVQEVPGRASAAKEKPSTETVPAEDATIPRKRRRKPRPACLVDPVRRSPLTPVRPVHPEGMSRSFGEPKPRSQSAPVPPVSPGQRQLKGPGEGARQQAKPRPEPVSKPQTRAESAPKPEAKTQDKPARKPELKVDTPATAAPAKKATKKAVAAKKAAAKVAVKKALAKKTVDTAPAKKAAVKKTAAKKATTKVATKAGTTKTARKAPAKKAAARKSVSAAKSTPTGEDDAS